jgi:hypothetical protein
MNEAGMGGDISLELANRVRAGRDRLMVNQQLMQKAAGAILSREADRSTVKMRRVANLKLDCRGDNEFWQILHNTPERYEIVTQKFTTTPSGGTTCLIEYYELGDNLPVVQELHWNTEEEAE